MLNIETGSYSGKTTALKQNKRQVEDGWKRVIDEQVTSGF